MFAGIPATVTLLIFNNKKKREEKKRKMPEHLTRENRQADKYHTCSEKALSIKTFPHNFQDISQT